MLASHQSAGAADRCPECGRVDTGGHQPRGGESARLFASARRRSLAMIALIWSTSRRPDRISDASSFNVNEGLGPHRLTLVFDQLRLATGWAHQFLIRFGLR